jgi:hypothetical protein
LLDAVGLLLKKKKLPPLGLAYDRMPNISWLKDVYFCLSPNDELKLFLEHFKLEVEKQVELDHR